MKNNKIIEQAIIRKGEDDALGALGRIESADMLKDILHSTEQKHRPLWSGKRLWAYACAVAVVGVVLTVGLQPRYSNEELYARWSEKVAYEPVVSRGEQAQSQTTFETALTLAQNGETTQAIERFIEITADSQSQYAEDAEWYLALTYLQAGERSRAKDILSQISETTSAYSIEATELLHELNTKRWF